MINEISFFLYKRVGSSDIDKITKLPKLFHIHNDIQLKD